VQVAKPVLRHRILLNYQAMADGVTPDDVVERLLGEVPAIRSWREARGPEETRSGFFSRLFGRRA
jgi:hypothetical protein